MIVSDERISNLKYIEPYPVYYKQSQDKNISQKYHYWLHKWLSKKQMMVKISTYTRYQKIVEKHIIPFLGDYDIEQLDSNIIEQFINEKLINGRLDKKGGLKSKTASDIMIIIKESFKYIKTQRSNVSCNLELITFRKNSKPMRILSKTEEKQLLKVLLNDLDKYKLGVFLCLYTGIRIGELCALEWKHFSFEEKTLKIEQTMQRLQNIENPSIKKTNIVITSPKSESSNRIIPLPDFIITKLLPYVRNSDEFFLADSQKCFVEPRTMQNKFKKYLMLANIEKINFHTLRHTFASRCVELGFDIKTLSEILGHASVKITLDTYVHTSLEQKRKNMNKLQPLIDDKVSL